MTTNSLKGIFLFFGLFVLIACQSGGSKSGPSSSIVDGGHSLLGGGSLGEDFNFGSSPDGNNSDEIETASTSSSIMLDGGNSNVGGGSSGDGGSLFGNEDANDGGTYQADEQGIVLSSISEPQAKNVFWKMQNGASSGGHERVYFNYIDQILSSGIPPTEDDPMAPFLGTVRNRGAGFIGAEAGQSYKAALRMAYAEAPFCLAKLATRGDLRDAVKPISGITRDQLSKVFYQSSDRDRVIDINIKGEDATRDTFVRVKIAKRGSVDNDTYQVDAVSCRQMAPNLSSAFVRSGHLIQSYNRKSHAYNFNLVWKRSHSLAGRGSFSDNLILKLQTTTLQPNLNGTYSYTNQSPIVLELDQSADNLTYRAFEDDPHLKWIQKAKFTISGKDAVRFSSYSEVYRKDKGVVTRFDRTYSGFDSTTAGKSLVNKSPKSICQALVKKSSVADKDETIPVEVNAGNQAEYSRDMKAYIVSSVNQCNGSSTLMDQFKAEGRELIEAPVEVKNSLSNDSNTIQQLPIDCGTVLTPDAVIEVQKTALPETDLKRCNGDVLSDKVDNYTASAESSISQVLTIIAGEMESNVGSGPGSNLE